MQRGALRRLDRSFQDFFRRCKAGDSKPGFPRFRSANRWNSISIDDLGRTTPLVAGGRRVKVPLLGKVKLHMADDRPLRGTPKALRLTFDGTGWYVTVACTEVPQRRLSPTGQTVGIDLGLSNFAATSDGEIFANPRPLKRARLAMERAQRTVCRRRQGSGRRRRAVLVLRSTHARIANVRREHAISVARSLVSRYDTIFVEDLNLVGLSRSILSKSFADAALGSFGHWLSCKAEEAGKTVVRVDPTNTTRRCSGCGLVGPKLSLSVRIFVCSGCSVVLDRDINAGRNIKAAGLLLRGDATAVGVRLRSAKPKSKRRSEVSIVV